MKAARGSYQPRSPTAPSGALGGVRPVLVALVLSRASAQAETWPSSEPAEGQFAFGRPRPPVFPLDAGLSARLIPLRDCASKGCKQYPRVPPPVNPSPPPHPLP